MDFSVRIGHSYNFTSTNLLKESGQGTQSFDATYLEGVLGFFLAADEKSSFRLSFGYGAQGYKFNQKVLGMANEGVYTQSERDKFTQFLTVSFGYTYYLGATKN